MKNPSPIILNCFSRGGSNILWNILLSHPEVCSPIEETLEIFRIDWRDLRWSGLQAAWLTRQWKFFDQWNLQLRGAISGDARAFIDDTLFHWKLKTLEDDEMRYKTKDVLYTTAEVENARLALKNNNGIVFLSEQFAEMYAGLTFFALVRDPIPLYESHKRNHTPVTSSPEKFASFYRQMIEKMWTDAERWDFYHILRFEDILGNPVQAIRKIYELAGLDIGQVQLMRFKAKPHMQANGSHTTSLQAGRHYWLSFDEVPHMLEPEVNQHQVSKLAPQELDQIRRLTCGIRSRLGYGDS